VEEAVTDVDAEPFGIGLVILVRWPMDSSSRLCTIIERAPRPDVGYRYYVHYHDFNRRMDEWVDKDRIIEKPRQAAKTAAARKKTVDLRVTPKEDDYVQSAKVKEENEGEEPNQNVELVAEGYNDKCMSGSGALDFGRGPKTRRPGPSHKHINDKDLNDDDETMFDPDKVTAVEDMEHDEHEGLDEASLKEHEEVTKVKNIGRVELGRHLIETWYFSPFPKEYYPYGYAEMLYVCEHTFAFFKHKRELVRWQSRLRLTSPPGDEIYRFDSLAMFEIDGNNHTVFCQNLCYFAKLFLDHKTLYFDVDPFLFYVLCEYDEFGYHPVGYFSKEKYSEVGYNLACILTFPPYQRKGYGRFLIAFSYALSKKEGKVGAPEKPLSDLGHVSYRSYWSSTLIHHIRDLVRGGGHSSLLLSISTSTCSSSDATDPPATAASSAGSSAGSTAAGIHKEHRGDSSNALRAISIMELSKATSIMADDVIATLQYLGLIRCVNGTYVLWASLDVLGKLIERYPAKTPIVNTSALHWAPFALPEAKRDKFFIRSKKPTPNIDV